MPKTCIHLEKINQILDEWRIELQTNSEDSYFLFSWIDKYGMQWSSWSDWSSAEYIRKKLREHGDEIFLERNLLITREDIKKLEKHLKEIRSRFFSIVNECNCGNENDQQLVSLRRNTETDLSVVRRERDNLQGRIYDLQSDLQRERNNYQALMKKEGKN